MLPIGVFCVGTIILLSGVYYCVGTDGPGKSGKCLTTVDKPYVAAFVGLLAAAVALWSWLASNYKEFERQRFELFERLHKEFRTNEDFDELFDVIDNLDEQNSKQYHASEVILNP